LVTVVCDTGAPRTTSGTGMILKMGANLGRSAINFLLTYLLNQLVVDTAFTQWRTLVFAIASRRKVATLS